MGIKPYLALVLALALLLAGCAGPQQKNDSTSNSGSSASTSAAPQPAPAPAASKHAQAASEAEPEDPAASLRVLLPADQGALKKILKKFAEKQGINIEIKSASKGLLFTQLLIEELEGEDVPDLYWLEGESAARLLLAHGYMPADMQAGSAEPQLAALAGMAPEGTRLLDSDHVYGMPLGIYAEGTLINLPMLADLLNTDDLAGLQRNLRDCSYNEWRVLIEAVEAFLKQPKKYAVRLAGQLYTLPRYRPESAANLRGIYANSTSAPGALLAGNLGLAYASAYLNPADLLDADDEQFRAAMENPLDALYKQLEFESQHFTTQDGPLARGEAFMTAPRITAQEARSLFAGGTALLYKADTREGLLLEQEYPELSGKMALVPGKLPIEDEAVAEMNTMQGLSSGGYLCINPRSRQRKAAGRLLVECFTTPEGQAAIEDELYLLPHTDIYPENRLLQQVDEVLNLNYSYILPATQSELSISQNRIGEWVFSELLGKEEWEEADFTNFMSAAQSVLTVHPDRLNEEMLVGGNDDSTPESLPETEPQQAA